VLIDSSLPFAASTAANYRHHADPSIAALPTAQRAAACTDTQRLFPLHANTGCSRVPPNRGSYLLLPLGGHYPLPPLYLHFIYLPLLNAAIGLAGLQWITPPLAPFTAVTVGLLHTQATRPAVMALRLDQPIQPITQPKQTRSTRSLSTIAFTSFTLPARYSSNLTTSRYCLRQATPPPVEGEDLLSP
jgi:hypothetical protein